MCLLTLPAVAPAVADSLGISTTYLGLYIAFAYIGAMASSLLAGGFVRRFGAIRASQIGLLLRSEEHTSELQSLMRLSYAVFCLKKKNKHNNTNSKPYNTSILLITLSSTQHTLHSHNSSFT